MSDETKDVAWVTAQIRSLLNNFEGKRLPDWVVGAVEGYCNRIDRLAGSITEALPDEQKTL